MPEIKVEDLPKDMKVSEKEMKIVRGGSSYLVIGSKTFIDKSSLTNPLEYSTKTIGGFPGIFGRET